MKVELIYECRNCKKDISVETDVSTRQDIVGQVLTVVHTTECENCCLNTTNNTDIVVIADLKKYIIG